MIYNEKGIEQGQMRLAIEHKQRMIARQAEIDKDNLALAQDTIRIALKTAGYENVDTMSQFERASAILNMAQELTFLRGRNMLLDCHRRNLMGKVQRGITA